MRLLPIMFSMLMAVIAIANATSAIAQEWSTYSNARYGATAEVPPGFKPAGPEANNAEGLIFLHRNGSTLTIYGLDIANRDLEAQVEQMMAFENSYSGWQMAGREINDDWAEFVARGGNRTLRVRIITACGGKIGLVTRFEMVGNLNVQADRVEESLRKGPARVC